MDFQKLWSNPQSLKNYQSIPDLIQILPENGRDHAVDWWLNLSESERNEFSDLWEESLEKDAKGLVLVGFDADRGYIFKGTFREGDDVDVAEFDDDELFDYYFNETGKSTMVPVYRVFHVCMAHPAAKACLDNGLIPHDFACPLGNHQCPMRTILKAADGRGIRVEAIFPPTMA
jgi:hypothetical protein